MLEGLIMYAVLPFLVQYIVKFICKLNKISSMSLFKLDIYLILFFFGRC